MHFIPPIAELINITLVHNVLWKISDFRPQVCVILRGVLEFNDAENQSWKGEHKHTAGSPRVYILFWHWPQLFLVEQIKTTFGLPASPAGYPEQENGPWWCWQDLRLVQQRRAEISAAWLLFTVPAVVPFGVSSPPGHLATRAYWEPSQILLCWEKNVLPHTLMYLSCVGTTPSHPKQLSKLTDVCYASPEAANKKSAMLVC